MKYYIPALFLFLMFFSACSVLMESTTADNLSSGSVIIIEKSYFDSVGEENESKPKGYKVIYKNSKDVEGGFRGEIHVKEDKKGWSIVVSGEGQQTVTHATEAVQADSSRGNAAVSASGEIIKGVVKGLAPLVSTP